jgi:hypothetical protein
MASSSTTKIPRALRLLAAHGGAALRPSLDKGKYIAPLVPRRIAADVRKRAIVQGTYGSFSLPVGGWDPAWDETKKMFVMRPYKGHLRDRNRKERCVLSFLSSFLSLGLTFPFLFLWC